MASDWAKVIILKGQSGNPQCSSASEKPILTFGCILPVSRILPPDPTDCADESGIGETRAPEITGFKLGFSSLRLLCVAWLLEAEGHDFGHLTEPVPTSKQRWVVSNVPG